MNMCRGLRPLIGLFLFATAVAALGYFSLVGKVPKSTLKGFTLENPNVLIRFALVL